MNTEAFFQYVQPFLLTKEWKELHPKAAVEDTDTDTNTETTIVTDATEDLCEREQNGKEKTTECIPTPAPTTTTPPILAHQSPSTPTPTMFIPKHKNDPLFWCLYVAKYGWNGETKYAQMNRFNEEKEFSTITNFDNQMMKEKQQLVDAIHAQIADVKGYIKQQRITQKELKEILGAVLSNDRTTIPMSFIWAYYYQYTLCFVNWEKKIYTIVGARDGGEADTPPTHIISFTKTKEKYDYELHCQPTEEIWKEVVEKCVFMKELYSLSAMSTYKIRDLEEMAGKWGVLPYRSLKKHLYDRLQEYLNEAGA